MADTERVALNAGEYMQSEMVDTGTVTVELLQNEYAVGDDVTIRYRHGATPNLCALAVWNLYTVPFMSLGYVEVRISDGDPGALWFDVAEQSGLLLVL